MHTRAAALQSLQLLALAHMKQNFPSANAPATVIAMAMLALLLFASACAKLPQRVSSEAQVNLGAHELKRVQLVNINTASTQELQKLPGIGKVMAERIVAHREQFGRFRRAEHLLLVRGISDRKFREMRASIVVE